MKSEVWVRAVGGLCALVAAGLTAATSPPEDAELVGDRPDFTESALTIAPGHVQLEAGLSHGRAAGEDEASVGEFLVRIGLAPRWELRLGIGSWARNETEDDDDSGWEDPSIEAKVRLVDRSSGPSLSLLFGSALPAGAATIGAAEAQPFAKFASDIDLSERFGLGVNLGYTRGADDEDEFDQVDGSVSLGASLAERWGAYLELYGFSREEPGGDESSYVDGGITWLAWHDLQLDARVGTGLAGNDVEFFGGVGVVKRW